MQSETLYGLVGELAAADGEAPAAIEVGARQVTLAELDPAGARLAVGLRRLGVRPGDAVAAWLPNRVEWLEVLLAAARLGAVVVGVNTRFRRDEVRHLVGTSGARVVVAPEAFLDIDFAAILAQAAPSITAVVVPSPGRRWRDHPGLVVPYEEVAADGPAPADGGPDDLVMAFTTSGTTGLPKLAAHDQASVVRHARADARAFDLRPGDRALVAIPLCGAFGFNTALAALAGGGAAVLQARFDLGEALQAMARHGVTHVNGSDDMLLALLRHPSFSAEAHASWRDGGFANFTNQAAEVVRVADERSSAALTGLYGASEVFALLSRWPRHAPPEVRALGGGIPVDAGIEVRAADPDTGAALGAGQEGELQFRGYPVVGGYLGNPEATAAAFTADGWYHSGDLGYVRPDGGFVYLARLKDSLRLRGFLVDPAEIEHRLEAHPDVDLAQVVGTPVEGRGDVAVAFVRLREGVPAPPAEDELRSFCAAGIADLKVPARIVTVDAFPVTDGPNGVKIRKVELRERAAALLGGEGGRG